MILAMVGENDVDEGCKGSEILWLIPWEDLEYEN